MANNRLSSVPGSKARVSPSMMSAQEAAATRAMMKSVAAEDLYRASVLTTPSVSSHPRLGQPTEPVNYSAMSQYERRKYNSQLAGVNADIYGIPGDEDLGAWYEYWDEAESGYTYNNRGLQVTSTTETTPAAISLIPTSTINPQRPRTVAAGYDPKRNVLTVVFRDGTFYNYYNVAPNIWGEFRKVTSKGRYIKKVLDAHAGAVVPHVSRPSVVCKDYPGWFCGTLFSVLR